MNLGFKEKINGKATQFLAKIWVAIYVPTNKGLDTYINYSNAYKEKFGDCWDEKKMFLKPKKHTIRIDNEDRWKVGNKIHFIVNNRTKKRFQFAPVMPVTAVQKIKIDCFKDIKKGTFQYAVFIDGRKLNLTEIKQLSLFDGFDTLDDFLEYFKGGFEGKIIHWVKDFIY